MKAVHKLRRREFIKLSAMSGAAVFVIGFMETGESSKQVTNFSDRETLGKGLNAYIFIDSSGKITIYNHRPEMGQGMFQSIPMIIAEELEVDIDKVEIQQSPADRSLYGDQMVVGSHSIPGNFELMRKMGAAAKEMLITVAATRWNVQAGDCYAQDATVIHRPTGRKLAYGELAEEASKLSPPQNPKLKDPKDFRIIGKSLLRRDIPVKTNGQAVFGIDCSVPGMLYASIEHSPVFLGKLLSFDDARARAVPGVKYVLKTERKVWGYKREGVAVIADSYWAAVQGRKKLEIKWDNSGFESWSSQKIKEDYRQASTQEAVSFNKKGNVKEAFEKADIKIEASYETPYQTHAPMEPMNATVYAQKDRCEFWGSTQNPNGVRSQLALQCNVLEEKVMIHYTFLGGGFGRRSMTDVAEEAADLSMKTGAPVKVIWTREDDLTQGPFRACSLNVCRAAIDKEGNLLALEHMVICQEINNQSGDNDRAGRAIAGGINTEYAIPNIDIKGVLRKLYIPITYWRSVYHSTNCFAHESFIDEIASAAKKDPLDFRLSLLKNHKRYTALLKEVAERSDWYKPAQKDTGNGVAIVERSGSCVAMVVHIARVNGKVRPVKITAAIDCGMFVNPDIVKAQTEGCIVMGLTATYKGGLTIDQGRVVQQNFDTYPMLRLHECPEIEIIVMKSNDPPEGVGEAGLPTVAPALCNAIFNMTGKRIRELPLDLDKV
ncbi:MAG TPA: molybdopterin cofactor-binding domain-containing protein [Puia sp.]|nr:molybdopterin cofactor-binding domain-containing protein [Puia sp.]